MQIEILNPNYSEWVLINTSTKQKYKFINNQFIRDDDEHIQGKHIQGEHIQGDITTQIINFKNNPFDYKLLTGDIIDNSINIILNSEYRSPNKYIPGILILTEKTYGRADRKKLYYKFIPDNKQLPYFLVPYENKNVSFNKTHHNQYALIHYHEWVEKHPKGVLFNVLGPVNKLEAYYTYQLHCKELNSSLQKFTKEITTKIKSNHDTSEKNSELINEIFKYQQKNNTLLNEDRRNNTNIFTIDPKNTKDFDDAISIHTYIDYTIISIYIANVPLLIDYLNSWNVFTNRVSTIYLPNEKKPMLPTILSDDLCSLIAGQDRLAFTMDIKIYNNYDYEIKLLNTMIHVNKNYIYEEPKLLNNPIYSDLLKVTEGMQKKTPLLETIENSHDIVAYYMILMNYECSKKMLEHQIGIYRLTTKNETNETNEINGNALPCAIQPSSSIEIPNEISNFLKVWNCNVRGFYCNYATIKNKYDNNEDIKHEMISANGLNIYTHITSPIRRIVDLINLIELQKNSGIIQFSIDAQLFSSEWINKCNYINEVTQKIKKVQSNCTLLHELFNSYINTNKDNHHYEGYIIEQLQGHNNNNNKYNVYIPYLKSVFIYKTNSNDRNNGNNRNNSNNSTLGVPMPLFGKQKFIIKVFIEENTFKQKIRLQLL